MPYLSLFQAEHIGRELSAREIVMFSKNNEQRQANLTARTSFVNIQSTMDTSYEFGHPA